ncbi:MAG: hypothetical protein ACOYB4_09395 [Methyloceanibacter sp.]
MKNSILIGALIALAGLAASPLLAEPRPWPWKDKTPPDPALVTLTSIEKVTASLSSAEPPVLTVTVEASAPAPGFTELQFAPRIGDPKDLIFAFDAKGRPPQDMSTQVVSPVTVTADYADPPADKVGVVEVHAQNNCKAFSIKNNQETACTSSSVPQ